MKLSHLGIQGDRVDIEFLERLRAYMLSLAEELDRTPADVVQALSVISAHIVVCYSRDPSELLNAISVVNEHVRSTACDMFVLREQADDRH